jgi:FtsP/CotA-like multicopper oxidase with cupredoxin domain
MSHSNGAGCPPEELHTQVEFSSDQPQEGSPETKFRQRPQRSFFRKFFSDKMRFPGGLETEIWSFEDDRSGRGLPAPLIRANEGDIVHVEIKPSKGAHTIHLHGVEPDPRNDGVGHSSFEVTGRYVYQFRVDEGEAGNPNRGAAGTYFYHCHVNTVLHVQMGMFGPMIFDPPTGRGKAFIDDPVGYDTRAETLLVTWSVDPRWHKMNHGAGLDGEDAGLNRFEPTRFYLLGGDLNVTPRDKDGPRIVSRILATADPNRPGLLRVNNASYFPTRITFGTGAKGDLKAELIAHDGRALRDTSVRPSPPITALTSVLSFGAAERYDMRLRPPRGVVPGDTFPVTVEWLHWITGTVVGTARTNVVVI